MDPHQLLQELCRRHGLQAGEHRDLLPLAEKAAGQPEPVRDRLLELIGEALRLRAERELAPRRSFAGPEQELLVDVARALHGWGPA